MHNHTTAAESAAPSSVRRSARPPSARAARSGLVAALLVSVLAGPVASAESAPASSADAGTVTAVALKVTATKVADPRVGEPLLLDVTSTGQEVIASVSIGGVDIDTKILPARFSVPTAGRQIGTSYRVDVDAANETQSGSTFERFVPQHIHGDVTPQDTTVAYSAPLRVDVRANPAHVLKPTGYVQLKVGSAATITALSDGRADIMMPALSVATHPATIDYSGDAAYAPTAAGSGQFEGSIVIRKMRTGTAATVSKVVLTRGDPLEVVAWTASADPHTTVDPAGMYVVSASPATGGPAEEIVRVSYVGKKAAQTIDISQFAATRTGDWTILTTNVGDGISERSSSAQSIRINEPDIVTTPTSTALTLDRSTATVDGDPVAATATVTVLGGAAADGRVVFSLDGVQVASAPVGADGAARAQVPTARVGDGALTARYLGSATQDASASSPVTLKIVKAQTSLPAFSATVSAGTQLPIRVEAIGSTATPTGVVQVTEAGSAVTQVLLTAGSGVLTVPALTPGVHTLRLSFAGDEKTAGSVGEVTLTVKPAVVKPSPPVTPQAPPRVTKVRSSVKASFTKASKHRVRAKITVSASKKPTGRIEVRYGKKIVARGTLKAKATSVTVTTKKLRAGKRKLTVRYLGSTSVKASSKAYRVKVR